MREVLCKSSGLEFVCIHVYKFFVTKHDIKRYNGSRQFYTVTSILTKQENRIDGRICLFEPSNSEKEPSPGMKKNYIITV